MSAPACLLIVSPHADDEVVAAPSVVLSAVDAGWQVVNLLCFLKPAERERRQAEVTRATEALGVELRLAGEPLLSASARSDPGETRELIAAKVLELVRELAPLIVLAPGPHDMHYAHEAVADGVRHALEQAPTAPRWLVWGWWGELGIVTTLARYDSDIHARAQAALAEHRGELDRLDLATALEARSRWNVAVGPERVMGPGYAGRSEEPAGHADVLLETRWCAGRWDLAEPRVVTGGDVLVPPKWSEHDLTPWLDSPSPSAITRAPETD